MSGFLRSTMKAVSTSSGIFEKMKSCTHRPVAPSPQSADAFVQIVRSKSRDMMLYMRCGTVRHAPTNEKSESAKFHSASVFTSENGLRSRMTRRPPNTSTRYATQMRLGVHGCCLDHERPAHEL